MDDDHRTSHTGSDEHQEERPPDLILQAIVPPTDAPAEIRAAIADALARRDPLGGPAYTWTDVSFAASAIALVAGTNQRADPDSQWVFALSADSPKLGELVRASGGWSMAIGAHSSAGPTRRLWRASLCARLTTEPRNA